MEGPNYALFIALAGGFVVLMGVIVLLLFQKKK